MCHFQDSCCLVSHPARPWPWKPYLSCVANLMCRSLCSSHLDLTWQRHRGRMSDSDLGLVACTAFSSHQAHPPQRSTTQHFVWSGNNIYNIYALLYLGTAFSSPTNYTAICNIWKQRRTLLCYPMHTKTIYVALWTQYKMARRKKTILTLLYITFLQNIPIANFWNQWT